MAIVDDLREIAERATRRLDEIHDFYEHSRYVWKSFRERVDGGHSCVANNPATGSSVDQAGLVALVPRYDEFLASFTFRQFVTVFESFLFDFLHRLLLHNPHQFAQRRLTLGDVLAAADRDEVISDALHSQLHDLRFAQPREWFAALERAVGLGCPAAVEIDRLAEMKAARDLLEHNEGVVNETYLRKAGSQARYPLGDFVEIDDPYHFGCWLLTRKVVADVAAAATARLAAS